MRRKLIIFLMVTFISLGSIFAAQNAEKISGLGQSAQKLDFISKLIEKHMYEAALKEAKAQYKMSVDDSERRSWARVELGIAEKIEDVQTILGVYKFHPDIFVPDYETGSILLSRYFIHHKLFEQYRLLRDMWKQAAKNEQEWFILDADMLRIEGNGQQAIAFLESREFEGGQDCPRLMRLALFYADQDPVKSWQLLERACDLNPKDPDVRSLRGRFLESTGRIKFARLEYLAAFAARPEQFGYLDQLAEFYRRYGYYKLALMVWQDSLSTEWSNGIAWIKSWFWNRVSYNSEIDFVNYALPKDSALPLAGYFLSLDETQFWDNSTQSVDVMRFYDLSYVCWLRALQSLKDGDELMVWGMLKTPKYRDSMEILSTELCRQLNRVLNYRQNKTIVSTESFSDETDDVYKHVFYEQLDDEASSEVEGISGGRAWQMPDEMDTFLKGKNAIAGVFLASGWNEVAIELTSFEDIDERSPEWFVYGLTMAIHNNKGEKQAIRFARDHAYTDNISVLLGEMMLEDGDETGGWRVLNPISNKNSQAGLRSCWVMCAYLLGQERIDQARELVDDRPFFYDTIPAKEVLARFEHVQGNIEKARVLYEQIQDKSVPAKIFLAWYSYENGQYEQAKDYIVEVLLELPEDAQLNMEVLKIMQSINDMESEE